MKKIDTSKWKEFAVGDLFPRIVKPPVFHVRETDECSDGVEYVVRSKFNNGVKYIVKRPATETNPIGTISFGAENASFFYRTKDWISGRDIYYIDSRHLTENACLFLISCLQKIAAKYPYNFGLFPKLLVKETIKLPITSEGLPDYAYMDKTVARLKRRVRKSLKSKQEEIGNAVAAKHKIDVSQWQRFPITELFDISNANSILSRDVDMDGGAYPYVTASTVNNGVSSLVSYDTDFLEKGNCIFIGGKTMAITYQPNDFFSNDSHNLVLRLKDKPNATEWVQLFIVAVLQKQLKQRYKWSDSISMKAIKADEPELCLPATGDGKPDFACMERTIKALSAKVAEHLALLGEVTE